MVQDLVDLPAELVVDLGDHPVDQRLLHRLLGVVRLEQLLNEGGDAALGHTIALVVRREAGLGDDAVEDATVFDDIGSRWLEQGSGHNDVPDQTS